MDTSGRAAMSHGWQSGTVFPQSQLLAVDATMDSKALQGSVAVEAVEHGSSPSAALAQVAGLLSLLSNYLFGVLACLQKFWVEDRVPLNKVLWVYSHLAPGMSQLFALKPHRHNTSPAFHQK